MDDESIFGEAIKTQSLDKRDAYLDQACGGDDQRRHRIEALLVSHDQIAVGTFLEDPAASSLTANDPKLSLVGSTIGQYKLREELGEGGMGVVYAAEQEKPVRRKVALKVIKPGMDTREVIARFEAERQALALMDHQNIARVLDAGATESGLPYFVMELVRGVTVTDYCDKNRLSVRDRLELFTQICKAVQHAHQKGIIHRDIKPSNVMITMHDGVPVPKVIDFGVAKAINQRLTEATVYTKVAQILGTPAYMSPEQSDLSGLDIDTRSDIYSLGVMLYELLTGSTPFTKDHLSKASIDEFRRVIRETDPERPSDRVSTLKAEAVSTVAEQRNDDPRMLSKSLRGELDWIVMKALEKDRNRRYETANGLAADVQRFLDDEPIVARPPSASYRFLKFAKRNKVGIAFGSAIGLFLIAAVVGLIASNILITRQKDIADKKTEEALQESKYAIAIADFVTNDFLALTSVEGQARFNDFGGYELGANSTLRELLDRAAEKLDARTDLEPRIEAQLRWIIGENYLGLFEFKRAIKFLEESVELHRTAYGEDAEETLVAQSSLAETYARAGQSSKAQPLFEQTYEKRKAKLGDDHVEMLESMNDVFIYKSLEMDRALQVFTNIFEKRKAKLGEDHPDTLESMNNLASIYMRAGQHDKAIPMLEQAIQLLVENLGENNQLMLTARTMLAHAYVRIEQLEKALEQFEQAFETSKTILGEDHPEACKYPNNLARCYADQERDDEAILLSKQTFERMKTKLGEDHLSTLNSMGQLGEIYRELGQFDKALPLLERRQEITTATFGGDHPHTAFFMNHLAWVYKDAGQPEKSLALFEKTFEMRKAKLGDDHPDTLHSMENLVEAFQRVRQFDKALSLLEKSIEIRKAKLGEDDPDTLDSMNSLAELYQDIGDFDKAVLLGEQVLEKSQAKLGKDHPDTLQRMYELASIYKAADQHDKSLPLGELALEMCKAKLGDDHKVTLITMNELAWGYTEAGRLNKAVSLFEQILELRRGKTGEDHLDWMDSESYLAKAYRRVGQHRKALSLLEQTVEKMKTNLGEDHWDTLNSMTALARAYQSAVQFEKALPIFERIMEINKANLADDHRWIVDSMKNLGYAYRKAGQCNKSVALLEQAYEISKAKLGEDDGRTLACMFHLSRAYQDSGQLEKAQPLLEQTVEMTTTKQGKDDLSTLRRTDSLAAIYLQLKSFTDAERLLRSCLAIREEVSPDGWKTFRTKSMLGGAIFGQQRYAEAEPFLLDGCQGLIEREDSISPINEPRLLESIQRLIQLYESWHKIDPEGGYDEKAAQWHKTRQEHEERLSPNQTK